MIQIQLDTKALAAALNAIEREQLPFAVSRALNGVAKDFQNVQFQEMAREFDLRRPDWARRSIKITHFARKEPGQGYVEVGIVAPGGGERSDIFGKFEASTSKRPRSGERIAIPVEAKTGKTGIVTAANRLKAFHFAGSGDVLRGDKRTYLIKRPGGRGLVIQRVGRGARSKTRILYVFEPEVPIKPVLHFEQNVKRVLQAGWEATFAKEFAHALATAK